MTVALSTADHSSSPPKVTIPRHYNAAFDLIERNLQAGRAAKVAYIDDEGSYSYGDLDRRVNRFANALSRLGIELEQRVLLCLHDTIDFPVAFLGSIKAGVVPIVVNTLLSPADYEHILNDSRARLTVVSAPLLATLTPIFQKSQFLRHVIVSGEAADGSVRLGPLLAESADLFTPAPTTCDDACFWLYSSGSTGVPKGTVHVHGSLIQTAELYARCVAGIREDDVIFSASKLPFAYGLGNSLTFPLALGATAVLMAERPTPAAIIERLRRYAPTIFCTIPTAYASLLAHPEMPRGDELRMRRCLSAGEALPEEIGKRWRQHCGVDILDGIGSTEMLHIFLSNKPDDVQYGTTGRPVPGYELRIVNEQGMPVEQGESGELQIRGPSCALHYWNNCSQSRQIFLGEWARSGDKYHRRSDGCYVYEGRIDDMLKVSGQYVSPIEVESALIEHDAVLEAAVVPKEDAEHLIKPFAFVVLKENRAVTEQALQQYVKQRLAPHKYPRWISIVGELPKTATGKIQRFKLRGLAAHR